MRIVLAAMAAIVATEAGAEGIDLNREVDRMTEGVAELGTWVPQAAADAVTQRCDITFELRHAWENGGAMTRKDYISYVSFISYAQGVAAMMFPGEGDGLARTIERIGWMCQADPESSVNSIVQRYFSGP